MVLKLLLNTRMIWIIFTTILIVFDDIIADMLSNKELDPSVIELFIRKRALKISLVFVTQSYWIKKYYTKYSTHYFIMKIPNKWKIEQITFNDSSDIEFQDFQQSL